MAGIHEQKARAEWLARNASGWFWQTSGRDRADRTRLYGGRTGLRIVCLHETGPRELQQMRNIIDWWGERGEFGSPKDVDLLVEGRWATGPTDRLLFTFDDGLSSNYEAAVTLSKKGLTGTFFIVPSFIGRTTAEFLEYHAANGVKAFSPEDYRNSRGLSRSQVQEMHAMGHRIAAHNFAHRSLGDLRSAEELHYEIDRAVEAVGELVGEPCEDFALAFGQPENVSDAASVYLGERVKRVYACHRGLNVPGRTPRFLLRHAVEPHHPEVFTKACLIGGADRHLEHRAAEMLRRVGALPDGGD